MFRGAVFGVPPAPTFAPIAASLIDWPGLLARYPGREAFVTRLAAIALDSQQEMPAKLRAAAAQQDLETLAFLAHSLKGSAGNLMAPGVQDLARVRKSPRKTVSRGRRSWPSSWPPIWRIGWMPSSLNWRREYKAYDCRLDSEKQFSDQRGQER